MRKYYLDMDYFIHMVDFPHMGVAGAIFWNMDCTADIYINTLYDFKFQNKAIRHELRHFVYDHAYCDYKDRKIREVEASDDSDPNVIFAPDFSWVILLDEQAIVAS